ncbi:hypothetical protein BD410DRAFT_880856, partial [Rickenella mellea]
MIPRIASGQPANELQVTSPFYLRFRSPNTMSIAQGECGTGQAVFFWYVDECTSEFIWLVRHVVTAIPSTWCTPPITAEAERHTLCGMFLLQIPERISVKGQVRFAFRYYCTHLLRSIYFNHLRGRGTPSPMDLFPTAIRERERVGGIGVQITSRIKR